MSLIPDIWYYHISFEASRRKVFGACPENRYEREKCPASSLQATISPCFEFPGKDTIPIQSAAKVPRLGTIGKNHFQSSLSY